MSDMGWMEALVWTGGGFAILCGAVVGAYEVWHAWGRARRKSALRILYKDINDHRITPRFNVGSDVK